MDSAKKQKIILIIIPLIFIAALYYRKDVCYVENYYLIATFTTILLIISTIKLKYSKQFTRLYLFLIFFLWVLLSFTLYAYLTQFVQHYTPCNWVFRLFFG
jgi:Ca2+/H+ antiporter